MPDYEAMYALHEPDEVVAAVDGKDVTWGELFYLYFSQAKQIETYFSNMAAYYGAAPDWDSQISEDSDRTFADSVAEGAESTLKEICAIEGLAAQSKVELSDEQLAAIRTQEEQDIAGAVGENGTEEDFNAYMLRGGVNMSDADRYLPVIYPPATAMDYIPADAIVLLDQPGRCSERARDYAKQLAEDIRELQKRGQLAMSPDGFCAGFEALAKRLEDFRSCWSFTTRKAK